MKASKGKVFGELADYYDLLYEDKNYSKELKFIEKSFPEGAKKILELGCGTGSYTKLLLEKGYDVTSIDISEKMLNIARKKVPYGKFIQGDIKDFKLNEKFDVCLVLFAVMGYVTSNED